MRIYSQLINSFGNFLLNMMKIELSSDMAKKKRGKLDHQVDVI